MPTTKIAVEGKAFALNTNKKTARVHYPSGFFIAFLFY